MNHIIPIFIVFSLIACGPAIADRQAECERKILTAKEAGIIHRMWVKPEGMHVVVDSVTWSQSSYTTKLGIATTVECAIVNPGERLRAVILHDSRTNKVVGEYTHPNLDVK